MSRHPVAVAHDTPVADAGQLFAAHRILALPVIDDAQRVVGIVTPADFIRHDAYGPSPRSDGRIGEIMTRKVLAVDIDRHLVDLIPLFGSSGHHHLPIVEADGRLAGVVTQSDVVAALGRAGIATSMQAPESK